MHSYISIVASHLGTLDARRVELKDKVEAELEDGVLVGRSRRWKYRLESCLGQRCYQAGATEDPAQGLVFTNTNLVLLPGKPRSITFIFSIQCYYLSIVH